MSLNQTESATKSLASNPIKQNMSSRTRKRKTSLKSPKPQDINRRMKESKKSPGEGLSRHPSRSDSMNNLFSEGSERWSPADTPIHSQSSSSTKPSPAPVKEEMALSSSNLYQSFLPYQRNDSNYKSLLGDKGLTLPSEVCPLPPANINNFNYHHHVLHHYHYGLMEGSKNKHTIRDSLSNPYYFMPNQHSVGKFGVLLIKDYTKTQTCF